MRRAVSMCHGVEVADDLRRELDEKGQRLDQRIGKADGRIGSLQATLDRQQHAQQQARKESARRNIIVQARGTICFFFGVVLSVAGSAVRC